jgi:hypothetical protein
MEDIAYCGLKCNSCPLYISTINNDEEMKKKLMVDYSTDLCTFTLEDMYCEGCHDPRTADRKMCSDCEVKKCASQYTISTCAECSIYPCEIIEKYVPIGSDNRSLLDQLSIGS